MLVLAHRNAPRRASPLLVALSGHVVEWYEFAVYGIAAAYIAGSIFPSADLVTALLTTWTAYAVAFFVRPLGGLILSHIADRAGRGRALFLSVLLMSTATALMAVVPGWETAGMAAPIAFTCLRALQGFAVGGEMSSAVSFALERSPGHRHPRVASALAAGTFLASLMGSLLATGLVAVLSEEQMTSWGWRLLFAAAVPLGLLAIALRARIVEPRTSPARAALPLRATLRHHRGPLLRFAAVATSYNVALGCAFGGYVNEMLLAGFERAEAVAVNTATYATLVAAILTCGGLSARIGRGRTLVGGLIGIAIGFAAMMSSVGTGSTAGAFVGGAAMAIPIGIVATPVYLALVESFPRDVRATAGGLGFNVAAAAGSMVPAAALGIRSATGLTSGLAIVLAVALIASLLAVRRRTEGQVAADA